MLVTPRYSACFAVAVSSLIRRLMWRLFMESAFRLRQRSSIYLRCFCGRLGGQLPLKTFMKRFGKICICLQAPIPLWYIFDICDQSSRRSTPSRCLSRPSGALAIRSRPSLGDDVWGGRLEGGRYEDEDHVGRFVPASRVCGARALACCLYPCFHRIDFALPGPVCGHPFRCYRRCNLNVGKRCGSILSR